MENMNHQSTFQQQHQHQHQHQHQQQQHHQPLQHSTSHHNQQQQQHQQLSPSNLHQHCTTQSQSQSQSQPQPQPRPPPLSIIHQPHPQQQQINLNHHHHQTINSQIPSNPSHYTNHQLTSPFPQLHSPHSISPNHQITNNHPKRKSSSNDLANPLNQNQPPPPPPPIQAEPITQTNPTISTTIIKKRRRRRSAITGTLYNPDEEPDPDQEILSQPNHQHLLNSPSLNKSKSNIITELTKKPLIESNPTPTSTSGSASKALEKKFACDWIGCSKVFSRPDHLSRHRLNHEPEKIYSCDRCPRKFVRADLLTRHVERHEKKAAASKLQPFNQIPSTRYPNPIPSLSPNANPHPNQLRPPQLHLTQLHPPPHQLPSPHQQHPSQHEQQHSQVENQHHPQSSVSPHTVNTLPLSTRTESQQYPGSPLLSTNRLEITDESQQQYPVSPHLMHPNRIPNPTESTSFSMGHPSPLLIPEAKVESLGAGAGRRTSDPPIIIQDQPPVQNPDYDINSTTPYSSIPFPSTTNTTPLISRVKELVEDKPSYPTDEFNITQGLPGTFSSNDNFAVDVPFFTGQDFQWLFDGTLDDLHRHQHLFHPSPNHLLEPNHLTTTPQQQQQHHHHTLPNEEENKNGFGKEMDRCHDLLEYSTLHHQHQQQQQPPPQDEEKRWNGNGLELVHHQHHHQVQQQQQHQQQHQQHQQHQQQAPNEEKKFKDPMVGLNPMGHHQQIQVQEKSEEILTSIPFLPPPPTPLPPPTMTRIMSTTNTSTTHGLSNEFELNSTHSKIEGFPASSQTPFNQIRDLSVYVSFETRDRIIQTVKNELSFLENDCRFGIKEMSTYLNLYWIHVHQTSFPILHRPTFKTSEASVFLLCLMMCLGAYFTDSEGHELATVLYEDIRKRVISSPEFKPRASLDIIQVTLLMILYGKLCSTRTHHEMAHIFWGSILTMYRRSALFSPRVSLIPNEFKNDIDVQWKVWIEDESSKRAAYAAFLIDVQHAAIFRHAPTLSAFQIQHVLPSDEEEWNAKDSISWNEIHCKILSHQRRMGGGANESHGGGGTNGGNHNGTLFMSALKASLMPGMAPPFLNPFSRVVILHGLISVAFDLQWRDVFMIGLVTSSNQSSNSNENASINQNGIKKDWRETIAAAFNSWKICLDSCLISSNAPAHQLLTASISIYALAHIVLSIDVHELQIYAGAEKTLGLTVANQVVESTKLKVKRWADSKEGRASTWHAAHFLRSSLIDLDQVSEMLHSLHYTWACYISVLTVVAYGTALDETEREMAIRNGYKDLPFKRNRDRKRRSSHHHDPKQNSLEIAMRYLDTICTSCPENLKDLEVVVDHQIDSIGLIEMIYQVIKSSRWEIALEGAKILDGLIVSKSKDLG